MTLKSKLLHLFFEWSNMQAKMCQDNTPGLAMYSSLLELLHFIHIQASFCY